MDNACAKGGVKKHAKPDTVMQTIIVYIHDLNPPTMLLQLQQAPLPNP